MRCAGSALYAALTSPDDTDSELSELGIGSVLGGTGVYRD